MTALARLPLARLTRTPRAWLAIVAWAALALVGALLARSGQSAHGADHALLGTYGAFALPLLVYAVVAAALGGQGLARAASPLVAFGAAPAAAVLATLAVAIVASALLGAALGASVAAAAHGASDPPLARDLFTSAWVGALGGAAYASLFGFGATFGAHGGGRTAALVLDWVLGSGGALAALAPRAHVRNLLGGAPALDMSQRAAFVALVLATVAYGGAAVIRASRRA